MGKYIGNVYKHSQYQISTFSFKTHGSSSPEPQTSSAIELTSTSVPSVRDKNQNNSVCIPKITYRMIQPSQTMTTYSLLRQQKKRGTAFQPL